MRYALLVLSNFKRHKVRLVLTILSIVVAFTLFGYLAAIRKAFEMGVDVAGADRLVVRHKVSIIQLLPADYERDIEKIQNVSDATPATWFGGIYKDPKNFFAQIVVKPDEWMRMYPEYVLEPQEKEAWLRTRTGVVVGRSIADRFGWKVGDRIPLQPTIWQAKGSDGWIFDVVGIYEGAQKETDTTQFFFRYDYFDENRRFAQGQVGWYHLRVADPQHADDVAAKVDAFFANSPAETKTETEGAFMKAFADQVGNIGAIVQAILGAVFFTILLVVGNTMAQSVRERTSELGVLKAVGFTDASVLGLILAESVAISVVGGGIGILIGWLAVSAGDPTKGALPVFFYPADDLALGIALTFALGLFSGAIPALQALRLNPVDALRRE